MILSVDRMLKVWNINTVQYVNTLEKHNNVVLCVAILPNGNIVSGSYVNTLKVWVDNNILQNEYHIRKTARILAQGYRDRNCLFSLLPQEVNHKIAGLTGNTNIHAEGQATEIAKRYFCKPPCPEPEGKKECKKRKRVDPDNESGENIKKFVF